MAISEFEFHRYEKIMQEFCKTQGPPPEFHDKLKWGFTLDPKNQSVVLLEIRPRFRGPSKKVEIPIAKARFIKARKQWKVYWMRGNGKWLLYEPCPSTRTIEEFLGVVKEDSHCCFFG
ncbi:MAG: DUF3024 domain-containing protein [Pseudodesulfovibrio sp.]|nr:DUF3024 domain-containing protein [Pseudodesulfovibrio sp.]